MSFKYKELEDSIVSMIRENTEGKRIGVAFSGGLDSGLSAAIAKRYADSVTLYTCGSENAYDVIMARDLSEKLELPWVHIPISVGNVEDLIKDMIVATGVSDPFTISYEMPLFCVCMESEEAHILSGQGADEFLMGCAKFVGQPDEDYRILAEAAVQRLLDVSVPCEEAIASHFYKDMIYPYIDSKVVSEVQKIDPEDLRPKDMDSRKAVLKAIAVDLGYPFLAERKKKSSQYGSGTTDIVRALARKEGKMYNEYIAEIYDNIQNGTICRKKSDAVYARIDPIIKAEAETILLQEGLSPSDAIGMFYRRIIADKGIDSIRRT